LVVVTARTARQPKVETAAHVLQRAPGQSRQSRGQEEDPHR
jgi:hypothetical protein